MLPANFQYALQLYGKVVQLPCTYLARFLQQMAEVESMVA